jgi:hypothetical protein
MSFHLRMRAASRAALFHFLGSLLVAALAAVLVFLVWYPPPYGLLSGGRKLFLILVAVDVVCGPLLTLILFSPKKPRREIVTDMSLVVMIQLAALAFGMYTAYQARPLFLVHEVDRFRVVGLPDYQGHDVSQALEALPASMRPTPTSGPVTVGVRPPATQEERQEVLFESVYGGRDYAQRPEFYVPYDTAYQVKVLDRAKPLASFVKHFPESENDANTVLRKAGVAMNDAKFLPVLHKQEWIAVMDVKARIIGFLPGDGFSVP